MGDGATAQRLFGEGETQVKQPTKDILREQLALAADEIMRLREVCTYLRLLNNNLQLDVYQAQARWWHRLMWWRK